MQEKDLFVPGTLPRVVVFVRRHGFWASLKDKSDGLVGTKPQVCDLAADAFTEEMDLKAELE